MLRSAYAGHAMNRALAMGVCVGLGLLCGCSRTDPVSGHAAAGRESAKVEPIAAPPPDPGTPPNNVVERYPGVEVSDGGQVSIRRTVTARIGAGNSGTLVTTLYPGTVVTRVARKGDYHLVAWTSLSGPEQGWVDGKLAFKMPWSEGSDGERAER